MSARFVATMLGLLGGNLTVLAFGLIDAQMAAERTFFQAIAVVCYIVAGRIFGENSVRTS